MKDPAGISSIMPGLCNGFKIGIIDKDEVIVKSSRSSKIPQVTKRGFKVMASVDED
eukprot:CAMPEP_0197290012 /NCGR_PEP_ID=MMETSP0890-20130614/7269_1 /TAXON_ID=44058 ORGANISM="Aureoumbra lagunensis, Strain CCMP1510" /NCGR_SAMPLE_ID=MMETSP0890 /ASSEMBLY_ACC=CAM_ASM_000533 /LENGTH=55 /DNA_ID=CAMNT_0042761775 /DNA_START=111 /DNA_END=278 /DNA_ORIENTATION=+